MIKKWPKMIKSNQRWPKATKNDKKQQQNVSEQLQTTQIDQKQRKKAKLLKTTKAKK